MRIKRPARKRSRISLTPLIDVVFLLLVFFMLASTFLRFSGVDLAGGRAGGARNTDVRDLVIVRVREGSGIDVNGTAVALGDLKRELTSLAGVKGIKVAVKPMGEAKVQDVVDVIEQVNISAVREIMVIR